MSLEVKVEIRSTVKKELNIVDGNTHSFIVYIQGLNGNQIEHFIKEVVFYLPSNAPNPKQVIKKPPYIISGFTNVSFRLSIEVFLYTSESFNKLRYSYYVPIPDKPEEKSVCVKTLTFLNCPQDFRERLLLGGAEKVNNKKKSKAVVADAKCKIEPVDTIGNQEQNTSKKNGEHFICRTGSTEDVNIQEEICDQLPNPSVQSRDVTEQNGSLVIQSIYCFDELLKENGNLKEANETLRRNFNNQESVIGTCGEKLPAFENDSSTAFTQLNQLKQKAEATEAEIANLKSAVEMIKSETLRHKNKLKEIKVTRKSPEIPVNMVQCK